MRALGRMTRGGGLVAVGVVIACVGAPPPPPGHGGDTSTGVGDASTSVAEATATAMPGTGSGTTSEADTGSTTGPEPSSSSTGPACTPGEEGCPCDEGTCSEGLACIEDECVVLSCGNGDVDVGEECDDANGIDSDGCDVDCTISAGAAQVIAGHHHVCALFHTGNIKCWGNGGGGRLGIGSTATIGLDETPAEIDFVGAPDLVVRQLALGSDFTCALLMSDEVVCWGHGAYGKLGRGGTENFADEPGEDPADLNGISFAMDGTVPVWIAAGGEHACAVMSNGALRCWGRNDFGQVGQPILVSELEPALGDDELPSSLSPVNLGAGALAQRVACGLRHTCVLLTNGQVTCFGHDGEGQLGNPDSGQTVGDDEDPAVAPPVPLTEPAVDVAALYDHTCVAYESGTIQCWGNGDSGQLGYGVLSDVGDNEGFAMYPAVDPVGSEPTSFGMGERHTCVRLASTQIYCWGEGIDGRLGYGNETDLLTPSMDQVNLALPLAPRMVTAGREFSCATTEGSEVKCWGRNNQGQLGYGEAWNTDLGDDEPINAVGPVPIE
jgi:cysteine-rich repeat protein